jgi:hypothetical protein
MKLTLDHTQRLNLHALLGAERADVGSIREIWAVQDRIALDADEEKAVEVKRELAAGQKRVVGNPGPRSYRTQVREAGSRRLHVPPTARTTARIGVNDDSGL